MALAATQMERKRIATDLRMSPGSTMMLPTIAYGDAAIENDTCMDDTPFDADNA